MTGTTVVGSYPRIGDTFEEQRLRRAIARFDEGKVSEAELLETERSVVRDAVEEQGRAGISLLADGQITWYDSQSHFARRLEGFEVNGLVRYFDTNTYYRQPVVIGRVRWRAPIVVDEWRYAASLTGAPVKAVLTGPYTLASLAKANGHGKAGLVRELGEALASEVRELRGAGATRIQIDEPAITRTPKEVDLLRAGVEAVASEKGNAWLCLFTFFGGVGGIGKDLAALPVDNLGLDLVQGGETWKWLGGPGCDIPVTLGVVDARNTRRDDPTALAKRIRDLKGKVPLEESYVSPSNGLEFLPRGKARGKLALVRDTARLVEAGS